MKVKIASIILGKNVGDILGRIQLYKNEADEFRSRKKTWSQKRRSLKQKIEEKDKLKNEFVEKKESLKNEIEIKRDYLDTVNRISQCEAEIQTTERVKSDCLNEIQNCQQTIDNTLHELEQLKNVRIELNDEIQKECQKTTETINVFAELKDINEEIATNQKWLREHCVSLTPLELKLNEKIKALELPISVEGQSSKTLSNDEEKKEVIQTKESIDQVSDDKSVETKRKPRDRKIKEIFDLETGDTIEADDFFNKPIAELERWRTIFQECISQNKRRFLCPKCLEMIRISGRGDERGVPSIFTHKNDSVYCHKTTSNISVEDINRRKYSLVGQSIRHKKLKQLLYNCLIDTNSVALGVENVQIEKRVYSSLSFFNWRQPDVQIDYQGKRLVFEIQLSTTFISVITERDTFYRLNDYYVLWIFNFEDNRKYVSLSNLAMKDIYFANKMNAFIFDEDARRWSEDRRQLVLKCNWLEPNSEWHFPNTDGRFGGTPVTLDQLNFDPVTFKPYYFDAETPYLNEHPEMAEKFAREQRTREEHINELERQAQDKETKRKMAIEQMIMDGGNVISFKEKTHYGFKYGTTVIVEPHFTFCEQREDGTFIVGYNKKKGIINQYGEFVVPCESLDLRCFSNSVIIYRAKTDYGYECWRLPYVDDFDLYFERGDDWIEECVNDCAYAIKLHNSKNNWRSEIIYCWNDYIFLKKSFGGWCVYDKYGNQPNEKSYEHIKFIDNNKVRVIYKGKKGFINNKAEETPVINEFPDGFKSGELFGKYCLISPEGELLCDYIYDAIKYYSEGLYIIGNIEKKRLPPYYCPRVQKVLKYYIVDRAFNVVSSKYSKIDTVVNGKAFAYKENDTEFRYKTMPFSREVFTLSNKGVQLPDVKIPLSNGNNIVAYGTIWNGNEKIEGKHVSWVILNENNVPVTEYYNELQDIGEGRIIAKNKNNKVGVIKYDGVNLLSFVYDAIKSIEAGGIMLLGISKNKKWGVIDTEGHSIIPIEYDNIAWYKKWRFLKVAIRHVTEKVKKYGRRTHHIINRYGLFDTSGKKYLDPDYSTITIDERGIVHVVHKGKNGHMDAQGHVEFEETVSVSHEVTLDVIIKTINIEKGYILVTSNDKTLFIHKSWLIHADTLESYNVGDSLKIINSGFDKQYHYCPVKVD